MGRAGQSLTAAVTWTINQGSMVIHSTAWRPQPKRCADSMACAEIYARCLEVSQKDSTCRRLAQGGATRCRCAAPAPPSRQAVRAQPDGDRIILLSLGNEAHTRRVEVAVRSSSAAVVDVNEERVGEGKR